MYKKILVPTDGSPLSCAAVAGAAKFAKPLGASIVLLTVLEPYSYTSLSEYRPESRDEYEERMRKVAAERLNATKAVCAAAGVHCEALAVKSFSPAEVIVDASHDTSCDCIFMASHGRSGLAALVLGSEAQKVLSNSKLPVMVYRDKPASTAGADE